MPKTPAQSQQASSIPTPPTAKTHFPPPSARISFRCPRRPPNSSPFGRRSRPGPGSFPIPPDAKPRRPFLAAKPKAPSTANKPSSLQSVSQLERRCSNSSDSYSRRSSPPPLLIGLYLFPLRLPSPNKKGEGMATSSRRSADLSHGLLDPRHATFASSAPVCYSSPTML
jgi:hypothetical protein